jgi:hypothetical protein
MADEEVFHKFKPGELNELELSPDDLFIPEGAGPLTLLRRAITKAYERTSTFNDKGLMRAQVLHAATVPGNIGPGGIPGWRDIFGAEEERHFAICRIPEIDACIGMPNINRSSDSADERDMGPDKLLLSLHGQYYSKPLISSDMTGLAAGDIVWVTKDGTIMEIAEKSPVTPASGNGNQPSGKRAFDDANYSAPAQSFESTPTCTEYDENMDIPNKNQHAPFIRELWPDFQPLIKSFICECWDLGISIIVNSTYRSAQHQQQMYESWATCANGRSKEAALDDCGVRPSSGHSFHNFGMAFDFNPTLSNGFTLNSGHNKQMWENTGVPEIARSNGIDWGGDWTGYYDPIHLQFRSWTIKQLARNEHLSPEQLSTSQFIA